MWVAKASSNEKRHFDIYTNLSLLHDPFQPLALKIDGKLVTDIDNATEVYQALKNHSPRFKFPLTQRSRSKGNLGGTSIPDKLIFTVISDFQRGVRSSGLR